MHWAAVAVLGLSILPIYVYRVLIYGFVACFGAFLATFG